MSERQPIFRADSPVESIFGLHGTDENDLSAAFAYALTVSNRLTRAVLLDLSVSATALRASVHIQTVRKNEGITDIEVELPGEALIVFEAKVGSQFPSVRQLAQYAIKCRRLAWPSSCLVVLTTTDEASAIQPSEWRVLRVPVAIRSWRWLARLTKAALRRERGVVARFVLRELLAFLEGFVGSERVYSNLVYVVSLASGNPKGWELSWIDIVKKYRRYFYAFGDKNWPTPPNYIGFRYQGQLQGVHHVEKFEVVPDVRKCFPGASRGPRWGPRYLLHLGPAIKPSQTVKTGDGIFRAARVWCMLDALLTAKTISKALDITKRRKRLVETGQSTS